MSDQLFDPAPFGGLRPRRARAEPQPEPMVRLCPPWVLVQSTRHRPVAHRWTNRHRNEYGGAITDCGAEGAVLRVDGNPLAVACPACLRMV